LVGLAKYSLNGGSVGTAGVGPIVEIVLYVSKFKNPHRVLFSNVEYLFAFGIQSYLGPVNMISIPLRWAIETAAEDWWMMMACRGKP
jgi:hypothetical protein